MTYGPSRLMAGLYCQILEHKWYLSERAGRDVGLDKAVEDYSAKFGRAPTASGGGTSSP